MTVKQAIYYSILSILTILFSGFIAFKVWWTSGNLKFLGIASFFLVGLGSLFLSIALTRLLISTDVEFGFSTLADKKKFLIFKDKIGSTKVNAVNVCYISLFLIFFAGTSFCLVISLNKYAKNQLMTFGRIQEVKINKIQYKGKGTAFAFFEFYLDGKKYTGSLSPKNYKVGDSATIIFSTNNTDIVEWEEDFNKIDE